MDRVLRSGEKNIVRVRPAATRLKGRPKQPVKRAKYPVQRGPIENARSSIPRCSQTQFATWGPAATRLPRSLFIVDA